MHINLRCVGQTISVSLLLLLVLLVSGCADFLWGTPKASFTCSPNTCYCHQQMTFDASGCSGGNDEIVQYAWNFGDGKTATGVRATHAYTSAGTYQVRLTITTEHGQEASATRTVRIPMGLVVPNRYSTIQAAIDVAKDGEVIVVLPGTYRESIRFRGKAITVQSSDPTDPSVVESTVIEGVDPGFSIIVFAQGETAAATLAGFTIRGGLEYPPCCGGGIYVREASPTIRNNQLVDHQGSAIYLVESAAKVADNVFERNANSEPGGAIVVNCYTQSPVIAGNTFNNNRAPFGGAIYITAFTTDPDPATAAPTTVTNNTFAGNTGTGSGTAPPGGGAIFVEFWGNLRLDSPDSNTYSGNDPDDIFYTVPPKRKSPLASSPTLARQMQMCGSWSKPANRPSSSPPKKSCLLPVKAQRTNSLAAQ